MFKIIDLFIKWYFLALQPGFAEFALADDGSDDNGDEGGESGGDTGGGGNEDDEDTNDDDDSGDDDEDEKDPVIQKVNKHIQKRLARQERIITTKISSEFERKLAEKDEEINKLKGSKQQDELVKPTRPKPGDYETTEEFDAALDRHEDALEEYREKKYEQKLNSALQQKEAKEAQRQHFLKQQNKFIKEEAKVREKIEDYDETVRDVVADLKSYGARGNVIMSLIEETGNPNIIYQMKDPDKFERVVTASTPTMVMRELTRIEAGLVGKPRKKAETTNAPGGGGGSASSTRIRPGDSVETYIQKRRKQLAAKQAA